MKTNDKIKIVLFTLIVIVAAIISLVIGGKLAITSGDSYYEERCIDVSTYLSQGYSSAGTDGSGCPLASITNSFNCIKTGYGGYGGGGGIPYGNADRICKSYFGSLYSSPYSSSQTWYCCMTSVDTKGGLEKVLNTCTADSGDLLVAQSFSGAKTITKDDLQYPIKSFCRAHPAIITDDALHSSTTSTNVPQDLIDSKSVSINSDQTITIFYYVDGTYNLPHLCSSADNLALDVTTNTTCKSTLGFTYICSQGVFDALTGSCVVQPGINQVCSQGRYDVQTGNCTYNPPLQVECPEGYTFDSTSNFCYRIPQSEDTCTAPYTLFSPTESECSDLQGVWQTCPQCPVDKICDQSICQQKCSKGVECRFIPDLTIICGENEVLNNGKCEVNGTTEIVCPTDSKWSSESNACIVTPQVIVKCPDGSNVVDGQCVSEAIGYKQCDMATEVLNQGECVAMTQLIESAIKPTTIQLQKTQTYNTYLVYGLAGAIIIIICLSLILIFKK